MYGSACRYLKGSRLFPNNAAAVAPTGLGTVGVSDGSVAVSAAEDENLEAGVGEVIVDGAVKPASPTLRARIVGQGYKQARGPPSPHYSLAERISFMHKWKWFPNYASEFFGITKYMLVFCWFCRFVGKPMFGETGLSQKCPPTWMAQRTWPLKVFTTPLLELLTRDPGMGQKAF